MKKKVIHGDVEKGKSECRTGLVWKQFDETGDKGSVGPGGSKLFPDAKTPSLPILDPMMAPTPTL